MKKEVIISLRLPREVADFVTKKAKEEFMTKTAYIVRLIVREMKKEKQREDDEQWRPSDI